MLRLGRIYYLYRHTDYTPIKNINSSVKIANSYKIWHNWRSATSHVYGIVGPQTFNNNGFVHYFRIEHIIEVLIHLIKFFWISEIF